MGNWRRHKKRTPADKGKKEQKKQARRLAQLLHPMATIKYYADAAVAFGESASPQELIRNIATFEWRDSLVAFARLAAGAANDRQGTGSKTLERWARNALLRIDGTNAKAMAHVRAWARGNHDAIIVHEEAIDYVQNLILLHGGETGGGPDDRYMVLWLLIASNYIETWEQESEAEPREEMIAKLVRVSRFNNSEDPVRLLVRVREMFASPPFAGKLADPTTWDSIQHAAFGRPFLDHLYACVLPLYGKCLSWKFENRDVFPVIDPLHWVRATGIAGQQTGLPPKKWTVVYAAKRASNASSRCTGD